MGLLANNGKIPIWLLLLPLSFIGALYLIDKQIHFSSIGLLLG